MEEPGVGPRQPRALVLQTEDRNIVIKRLARGLLRFQVLRTAAVEQGVPGVCMVRVPVLRKSCKEPAQAAWPLTAPSPGRAGSVSGARDLPGGPFVPSKPCPGEDVLMLRRPGAAALCAKRPHIRSGTTSHGQGMRAVAPR